ncbi:restriction endonuclease subunit S [Halomonas alkalicola]|uniref:restriction endonuclease subunit S n=1 Tax=Halomonas alkalicola TaxID=1930622 RepID=UPI0035EFB3A6
MVNDLPGNWVMISLGDIIRKIEAGKNYRCIERPPVGDETGIVKVSAVSWGQFRQDESKTIQKEEHRDERYLIRSGDLLMSRANTIELVGASVIVGEIQRALQLSDKVLRLCLVDGFEKWVNLYINSRGGRVQIESLATGAQQSMRNISQDSIRRITLPFPPLNEQRRIVDKIESLFVQLDHGEASLRGVQQLLARYRQSVLKAAVTGQLTADWRSENADRLESGHDLLERILQARRENWQGRGKYKEPVASDTSDMPELPEGWAWASFEQLFDVYGGATPSRKDSKHWNGDIPWVSSGEVAFCRIKNTEEKITEAGYQSCSTKLHPEGTVLLAMIGEGKTRGQAAILDIPACNNQNSAAIRVSESGIPCDYVYYYLMGRYQESRRAGQGGNQPALNGSKVKSFVMPLPSIDEMREIATRVDEAFYTSEALATWCETELTRSAALRQSILKDAFAGKLVPQDPNDEPANELLARIRAERDAAVPKKRTRKKVTA